MAGSALLPWEAPLPLATVGGLDGDWTSAGGGAGRRGGGAAVGGRLLASAGAPPPPLTKQSSTKYANGIITVICFADISV